MGGAFEYEPPKSNLLHSDVSTFFRKGLSLALHVSDSPWGLVSLAESYDVLLPLRFNFLVTSATKFNFRHVRSSLILYKNLIVFAINSSSRSPLLVALRERFPFAPRDPRNRDLVVIAANSEFFLRWSPKWSRFRLSRPSFKKELHDPSGHSAEFPTHAR